MNLDTELTFSLMFDERKEFMALCKKNGITVNDALRNFVVDSINKDSLGEPKKKVSTNLNDLEEEFFGGEEGYSSMFYKQPFKHFPNTFNALNKPPLNANHINTDIAAFLYNDFTGGVRRPTLRTEDGVITMSREGLKLYLRNGNDVVVVNVYEDDIQLNANRIIEFITKRLDSVTGEDIENLFSFTLENIDGYIGAKDEPEPYFFTLYSTIETLKDQIKVKFEK